MTDPPDLKDLQGNLARGYRLEEFTQLFCTIDGDPGRWKDFLGELAGVVTRGQWSTKDRGTAINVGISYAGLQKLHPTQAPPLADAFPAFAAGMHGRAPVLGDPVDIDWRIWAQRDIWIAFYGSTRELVETQLEVVRKIAEKYRVEFDESRPLKGPACRHGKALVDEHGNRLEHFGFRDGKANPVFDGMVDEPRLPGNGKRNDTNEWQPIATGELLLGYPNEQGQNVIDPLPKPLREFLNNGTFAVLRVLEQNVPRFHEYVATKAHLGLNAEDVAARIMGRTRGGDSLAAPGREDFEYRIDDPSGAKCPLGAHVRRANPRISGEHRLLRRSVTFGDRFDPQNPTVESRGMYFIAMNASIEDQFEFIQRNYLNGEAAGQRKSGKVQSAKDPLAATGEGHRKMAIEGDVNDPKRQPILLLDIPQFVTCCGGQYYFMPSISGLKALARRDGAEWATNTMARGVAS